jgi:hypothetical protein
LNFYGLGINYSYSALVDITSNLSDYMNLTAGPYNEGEMVHIPTMYKMESAGVLNVGDLRINSEIGLVAIIDNPPENGTLYVCETIPLTGRANKDIDGTLFNYTWTDIISGRLLGYGSIRNYKPMAKGNMSIQLKVLDQLHDKEATLTVHFQVVERPSAILTVSKVSMINKAPKEGESVSIKVTIKNTGKLNATNVGFQVFLDKDKGNPIAADTIDRVDIARPITKEVFWDATNPGDHKLLFKVVRAYPPFTETSGPFSVPITVVAVSSADWVPYVVIPVGLAIGLA